MFVQGEEFIREHGGGRIGDISIFGLEGYAGQHHISEMMGEYG